MAFDGLYMTAITKEMNRSILDTRLDKIHQPEKNELSLVFRPRGGAKKLLMTSSADHARVHLTEESKPNPKEAPLFIMVLRKYIQGGRLTEIRQPMGDRILILNFEATDDMGFFSDYLLISEMMGRHSNIVLVRKRDMKIMEAIKHVGADVNTYRLIMPGATYILPPAQNKLDPSAYEDDALQRILTEPFDQNDFARYFSGVSKQTSQTLYKVYIKHVSSTGSDPLLAIRKTLEEALATDTFYVFIKNDAPMELSLVRPPDETQEEFDAVREFPSPSAALDFYIGERDKKNRVKERAHDILRVIQANIDRVERKIKILNNVLLDAQKKEEYLVKGELLKANLYNLQDGQSEVIVQDFYDEEQRPTTIRLDENKTITENMQIFFHRYNKMKRSEENAQEQLLLAEEELDYLNSVQDSVMRSEDPADISEIRQELIVAGYIRFKSTRKKKESPSKPMSFESTEGFPIYVGKNNNQNDYLTTKFAGPADTWLHTKNYPGSHVIIRGTGFGNDTLLEAANLAAWYSKAQAGSKVPVDYTLVRHVKKPNGSRPGMVIYTTNKTIYVDPGMPRLKRL